MATFAYGQGVGNSDCILIIAAGPDIDQPGITAFIKAQIEFVPIPIGLLPSSAQVNFRTNFQDAVTADEGYIISVMRCNLLGGIDQELNYKILRVLKKKLLDA